MANPYEIVTSPSWEAILFSFTGCVPPGLKGHLFKGQYVVEFEVSPGEEHCTENISAFSAVIDSLGKSDEGEGAVAFTSHHPVKRRTQFTGVFYPLSRASGWIREEA